MVKEQIFSQFKNYTECPLLTNSVQLAHRNYYAYYVHVPVANAHACSIAQFQGHLIAYEHVTIHCTIVCTRITTYFREFFFILRSPEFCGFFFFLPVQRFIFYFLFCFVFKNQFDVC